MPCMSLARPIASLTLFALSASLSLADTPLPAFEAEYEVSRNGKRIGSSTITLAPEGDRWRYRSNTAGERGMASLVGLRVQQQMDFVWQQGQPQPLLSNYEQQATLSNRSVTVRYDWNIGRYQLSDRRGEHEHALPAGTVDRYGSGLNIAAQLAAGEREFTLPVAHADGIRDWTFRVTGEEAVEGTDGRVQALRVERIRDDSDRSTVSWHDPQRDYIAVRLVQREDGNTIESRLRSYRATR